MKLRKVHPGYPWRHLAQRVFHRAHPEAPLIVANALPDRFDGGFTTVPIRSSEPLSGAVDGWSRRAGPPPGPEP